VYTPSDSRSWRRLRARLEFLQRSVAGSAAGSLLFLQERRDADVGRGASEEAQNLTIFTLFERMHLRLIKSISSAAILIGAGQAAWAQAASWQKIAPAAESFTVMMPTKAVESSRLIPLGDKGFIHE